MWPAPAQTTQSLALPGGLEGCSAPCLLSTANGCVCFWGQVRLSSYEQQVGREGRARAPGAAAEQAGAHSHRVTWLRGLRRAQVYRPLEFLFAVAAFTTLAENFLPQLIALPKARSCLCSAQCGWCCGPAKTRCCLQTWVAR